MQKTIRPYEDQFAFGRAAPITGNIFQFKFSQFSSPVLLNASIAPPVELTLQRGL